MDYWQGLINSFELRVFLSAFVFLEFAVLYLSWAWPRYIRSDES
jgi:hypothetical protein